MMKSRTNTCSQMETRHGRKRYFFSISRLKNRGMDRTGISGREALRSLFSLRYHDIGGDLNASFGGWMNTPLTRSREKVPQARKELSTRSCTFPPLKRPPLLKSGSIAVRKSWTCTGNILICGFASSATSFSTRKRRVDRSSAQRPAIGEATSLMIRRNNGKPIVGCIRHSRGRSMKEVNPRKRQNNT